MVVVVETVAGGAVVEDSTVLVVGDWASVAGDWPSVVEERAEERCAGAPEQAVALRPSTMKTANTLRLIASRTLLPKTGQDARVNFSLCRASRMAPAAAGGAGTPSEAAESNQQGLQEQQLSGVVGQAGASLIDRFNCS